jgi:hypothetical protein
MIGSGRIALQCTPPASKTLFRNLKVRKLRFDETLDIASPNLASSNNPGSVRPTTLPRPILYIPGDRDVPSIPSSLRFSRMEGDYVDGKIGKGVQFNGKQMSEINVPFPTGNEARTLAFWMKSNRGPTNQGIHVITFGPVEKAKPFGVMEAAGKWRFFDLNGGLDSQKSVDRNWHHHAVSFDGKTVRYYIDGSKVSEVQRSLATVKGSLKIGGLGDPLNNFVGILDELSMFNQALSDAQVNALYNHGTGSNGIAR